MSNAGKGGGGGRVTSPLCTCHFCSNHPRSSMFFFFFHCLSVFSLISLLPSPRVRTGQTAGLTKQSTTRSGHQAKASQSTDCNQFHWPPTSDQTLASLLLKYAGTFKGTGRKGIGQEWEGI